MIVVIIAIVVFVFIAFCICGSANHDRADEDDWREDRYHRNKFNQ